MPGPVVHLWPGRRIIGWHWPSGGVYIYVQALSQATDTHFRSGHSARLTITDEGKKYGGVVVAQKNFEITDPIIGNPYTLFRGVMKFTKNPKVAATAKEHYTLTLSGARSVTDPAGETVQLFCGASSSSGQVCYSRRTQAFSGGVGFDNIATVFHTESDPNGTTSVRWEYMAADVPDEAIGQCFPLPGDSSSSLWYLDAGTGKYVNTHQPCPAPPDATPKTHTEGFNEIYQELWPVGDYNVKDLAAWIGERDDFVRIRSAVGAGGLPGDPAQAASAVLTAKTKTPAVVPIDPDSTLGRFLFMEQIPRKFIGLNSDHNPEFDDMPDDDYKFVLQTLTFTRIPKPTSHPGLSAPDPDYTVLAIWPLAPSWVKYNIFPATVKIANVPTFKVYAEAPLQTAGPVLPAGVAPPSDQDFTPLF